MKLLCSHLHILSKRKFCQNIIIKRHEDFFILLINNINTVGPEGPFNIPCVFSIFNEEWNYTFIFYIGRDHSDTA